jgi:hypothetical protein
MGTHQLDPRPPSAAGRQTGKDGVVPDALRCDRLGLGGLRHRAELGNVHAGTPRILPVMVEFAGHHIPD